ncbi:NAD-glutamate dehydrogenase [Vibrio lentus]|nr:NAD-glutamate dehydrogenase [Vibrio lentus]
MKKKADEISGLSVSFLTRTVSRQGWQSTHTIVEIVVPDSPFLVDSVKNGINSPRSLFSPYASQPNTNLPF